MPQIPILLQIAKLILYLSQGILPLKENRKQHDQEPSQTPGLCSFMSWANEHASFRGADPAGPPQLGASEGGRAPPGNQPPQKPFFSASVRSAHVHTAPPHSARLQARARSVRQLSATRGHPSGGVRRGRVGLWTPSALTHPAGRWPWLSEAGRRGRGMATHPGAGTGDRDGVGK